MNNSESESELIDKEEAEQEVLVITVGL